MKLISEEVRSGDLEPLHETTKSGEKQLYIEGIFAQAEIQNQNGRIYPHDILIEEIEKYNKDEVKENTALGELDHPESPDVRYSFASHRITELKVDGNDIYGKALILDTVNGNNARGIINGGTRVGISTRGLGEVEESTDSDGASIVKEGYILKTFDIVGNPSAPSAYVNGIMESVNWDMQNGIIRKSVNRKRKKRIHESSSRRDEKKLYFLGHYLKSI